MSGSNQSTARVRGGRMCLRTAPVAPGWLLLALCCTWMCGAVLVQAGELPAQVKEHTFVRVDLEDGQQCFVLCVKDNRFQPVDVLETKTGMAFTGAPGHYAVMITGGSANVPQYVEIVRGDIVPPGPEPPKPDPPGPGPTPAPIAMDGLRVLFVYESATLSSLPAPQRAIMQSTKVMDWMNRQCHKVDGRPEWRMADQHTPVAFATPFFTAAIARPRSGLPWVMINNGTKGSSYEGPLPATVDEMLALLEVHK